MTDIRLEKLARTLVEYSIGVKPGDWTYISASMNALPLAREVMRYTLRAGGNANVVFDAEDLSEVLFKESSPEQLSWISPIQELVYHQVDALVSIRAPSNTRALSGVDPKNQQIYQKARRDLTET